jgi:uncharacterized SAM-binding protein YcdF (DUF218 family)
LKNFPKRHRVIGLAILAATLLVLAGGIVYFFPQQILTIDSGPVKADVLVVLGGAPLERPARAAELFKQGEAPRILVSGLGDDVQEEHILETNGVPAAVVFLEGKSRTTRENAEFSIPLLRAMGAKHVILVTSWYHSRRALCCFEHYAPDLQFYSRPSYFGYPCGDWRSHGISGYIKVEYAKLLGYWFFYGICPL